jgi:uncharacterized protein
MHPSRYNLVFEARTNGPYLVLNPLSGAMDFFDERAISLLKIPNDQEAHRAFPDFFQHCRERGYLYESPRDEEIAVQTAYERSLGLYRKEPFRAEVYLTFLCNLRCTYCFQGHRLHGRASLIQSDVIVKLFEAIAEFSRQWGNQNQPILNLVGGEPLLNRKSQWEAIARILEIARSKDYRVGILTNGVALAAYSELLARYNPDFIQVTLDGPKQVHDQRRVFADGEGSFDYIVQGIDRAVEKGLRIVVRVNIDAQNVDLLPALADFIFQKHWLDKGVTVGVTPVDEFVPENEWCAEQTKLQTLQNLLELKKRDARTRIFSIGYRLAQFFDYIVANGRLPHPTFKYCPAVIGSQVSFDYEGKMFACC